MCKFSTLFEKLHQKNLPAIVVRTLIFVYEEQNAWVKWGNTRSEQFRIVNGTRQGSVLSPAFFSVYIDDLLSQLRKSGVGCHIGGKFFGAAGYADDIILLAPCRSAMEQMIRICEEFGQKNNLKFSTDPNPAKSKTKCLYMCGPRMRDPVYPFPLQLYGQNLPWVTHATHLGHELHQDGSMDMDIKMKRANFIRNSMDIRNMFNFALPEQILNAVKVYSAYFYGAMTWDLYGDMVGQVYRSRNTCVKLVWDLPRATHNYFVEHLLAKDFCSVRKMLLTQYVGFIQRLRKSVSQEVRILSEIVGSDVRSVTGKNCLKLMEEFSLDPWKNSPGQFAKVYKFYDIPDQDRWRLPLLGSLMKSKCEMAACGEDLKTVTELIESLCYS